MFSVIVPAYNPGKYFDVAVRSIVEQTLGDWELIVVDDGSREEEASLIASVLEAARQQVDDAGRIRLITQENAGVSVARNHGIAVARGEWIAFLDNDDVWLPTMLETQRKCIAQNPDAALCYTDFDIIDGEGELQGPGWGGRASYVGMVSGKLPLLPSSAVVKKVVLNGVGGFDPLCLMVQDTDFFFRIAHAHTMAFSDVVQMRYRIHAQNASRRYIVTYRELLNLFAKHGNWGALRGKPEIVRAARRGKRRIRPTYGAQAYDAVRAGLKNRDFSAIAFNLYTALRLAPRSTLRQLSRYVKRS